MRVLVTGASGLIGLRVALDLLRRGHEVLALARNPESIAFLPAGNVYPWKNTEIPPPAAFRGVDAIVHLAGENVASGRWTQARKKSLAESRVLGTSNLLKAVKQLESSERPKTFVGASAIGIYGNGDEEVFTEDSVPGTGFLAELCVAWERESRYADTLGMRTVLLRTGVVLAADGGALPKMGPVILGAGSQWLSWIHIDDVVGFLRHAIANDSLSGPFNLTAPAPVRQREFVKTLQKVRGYPLALRAPKRMLSLVLGEMAETVAGSLRAEPARLLESGYKFEQASLQSALESLFPEKDLLDQSFSEAQFVNRPREAVVPFFAKAGNLEELTPPWLKFRITRKSSAELRAGATIDYRLRIHGVPVRWRTLISSWSLPDSFADDQLKGPYRKWHHVHEFVPVKGGTLLTDRVTYQVPFSWIGKALLSRLIARDVRTIFQFRKKKIRELERTGRLG
jgi:uncharacterized protein (TIGR01777 family)